MIVVSEDLKFTSGTASLPSLVSRGLGVDAGFSKKQFTVTFYVKNLTLVNFFSFEYLMLRVSDQYSQTDQNSENSLRWCIVEPATVE